jgi:hypothetical protein
MWDGVLPPALLLLAVQSSSSLLAVGTVSEQAWWTWKPCGINQLAFNLS